MVLGWIHWRHPSAVRGGKGSSALGGRCQLGGARAAGLVLSLAASAALNSSVSAPSAFASDRSRSRGRSSARRPGSKQTVDVVLSSGFLSFANHTGFLKAVDEAGYNVGGIMGTSAGALTGSLYAAGFTPDQIAQELSKLPPAEYLGMGEKPWDGGLICMNKVIQRYRELLPPTFEELPIDFAVAVYTAEGEYRVVDSGPLPEAVVASAAIPLVFQHVAVPGVGRCMDGGKFDRVGLAGWQARRRHRRRKPNKTLVHLIARSSPFSGTSAVHGGGADSSVVVCRSPKSGVSLTSLGDFDKDFERAYERVKRCLAEAM